MKTYYQVVVCTFLSAALVYSCSKKNGEEDPSSGDTFKTLDAMLDKAGESQKLWVDIAPIELPDYVIGSEDSMKQKIVAFAALIDSSRERAIFPEFAKRDVETKLKLTGSASDDEWVRECYMENTPYWFCRSTSWQNDGKLKIVYTQQDSPEAMISHFVIDGEHSNGVDYDSLMIQYWLTLKDLTYSEYAYRTIFYPDPPCGPNILWRFITEVEGEDAWLHFMGESKSLATEIHTVITYHCDFIEGHHIWYMKKMIIQPDGNVLFQTYIYSLNLHDIYLWISYACMEDHSWVLIEYNEDGSVEERKQWPPE